MLQDLSPQTAGPIGLIVHIGAGFGAALDSYLALDPEKILLLEPNPEALKVLSAKARAFDNVTVIGAAVTQTDGQAPFHLLNFTELSSLHRPEGLLKLLPGLRVVASPEVATLSLANLFKQLAQTTGDKANWLVIEAPGAELDIAQALTDLDGVALFENLQIRCSAEPLFASGSAAPAVLQCLQNAGYQIAASELATDPDWPIYHLHVDQLALENRALKARLAALETQALAASTKAAATQSELQQDLETQGHEYAAARDQIRTATDAKNSATAQLQAATQGAEKAQAAQDKRTTEAKQAAEAAAKELQDKLASAAKAKTALEVQINQIEATVGQVSEKTAAELLELQQELDTQSREYAAARSQIRQATEAKNNAETQASAAKAKAETDLKAASAERETLSQNLQLTRDSFASQFQAQEDGLKKDLRMALQLQLMARGDLADLQTRYDALQMQKTRQEDLLIRLTQKLGIAVESLHLLGDLAPPREMLNRLLPHDAVDTALPDGVAAEEDEEPEPASPSVAPDIPTSLFYFPDYSATNPYQPLTYAPMAQVQARAGSIDDALLLLEHPTHHQRVVLHLHWLKPLLAGARSGTKAEEKRGIFRAKLARFVHLGGVLLWTIHEGVAEGVKFADTIRALGQDVADLAARIHIHSKSLLGELAQSYKLDPAKLLIAPHPSYISHYRNYVTQDSARNFLDLPQGAQVFLFFGTLAPHKGLDRLVHDFSVIQKDNPNAHLLIVGNPVFPYSKGVLQRKFLGQRNVQVIEGYVADADLQWYFNAADWVVLPDNTVLASGVAHCALSFARPLIAPARGVIPDLVTNGVNGFTYDPAQADGLLSALQRAVDTDANSHTDMLVNAFEVARPLSWDALAASLLAAITQSQRTTSLEITFDDRPRDCALIGAAFPPAKPAQTAIIILNYGHLDDTRRLVATLDAATCHDFDIYIVDNATPNLSDPDFAAYFPGCTVLRTPENLGYGAGNNAALRLIENLAYEFLWILNPDITVTPEALQQHIDAATAHPDIGIFGPVLCRGEDPNRVASAGSHLSLEDGLSTGHMYAGQPIIALPKEPYIADFITGAAIFMRTSILEKIGLIPEEYFLYFEETEWLLRAAKRGEACLVLPHILLTHYKRSEMGGLPAKYYLYYYLRNALVFAGRMGRDNIAPTLKRLRGKFIANWLARVAEKAPDALPVYDRIVEQALSDGAAGKVGKIDLVALELSARPEAPVPEDALVDFKVTLDAEGGISGVILLTAKANRPCHLALSIGEEIIAETMSEVADGAQVFHMGLPAKYRNTDMRHFRFYLNGQRVER